MEIQEGWMSTETHARRGYLLIPILCLTFCTSGCKESPRWAKAGAFFSAPEKAFPARTAVVHVYWPREERGKLHQVFVRPCQGSDENALLPGGYASWVVEPGPSCFQAEATWDLPISNSFASEQLGKVEIQSEPGHSYFIRLERKRALFLSRFALRQMEPAAAEPEIRQCRRSVPLSSDEIATGLTAR